MRGGRREGSSERWGEIKALESDWLDFQSQLCHLLAVRSLEVNSLL